ncbi:antirepressor [Streptococcus gallolyticus subsp. gallolyticus]|uniref:phage antirepressor KilAC domain-containing protein n=1 Tax=Streptococcus gallolyticus TaxID=315405 RepID=UPI0007E35918|nr:phage antirepressor KilAC domain-containing protein [Streptococcus gallolyticus]OAV82332.1 antirepressor [Streptococcus gallolyticus subsp. gallolyticus]OCW49760.1 antirepressor [Streptococcus gallolyticus subsp. gallolyticus]QBX16033.1 antirepressor protein [Streptococcus phage Javan231]QBX16092.1 antirepressor protein [Streptococcus phage Javan233]
MNKLINVTLNENQEPVVSGRQLHQVLGVKTRYDNWFNRMTEYGFTENQDYLVTSIFGHNSKGGKQSKVDHVLKLDMAKEIAMIQRTDKGKEVRQYFIQVEKDFNSPEKIMARALKIADRKIISLEHKNETLQLELEEARKQTDYLDLILQTKDMLTTTQIAQDYGMSANKFNQILKQVGIQRKVNGQWILYTKYQGKGYIASRTFDYVGKDNKVHSKITTVWTQLGRRFIYEKLKDNDIYPLIEQVELF